LMKQNCLYCSLIIALALNSALSYAGDSRYLDTLFTAYHLQSNIPYGQSLDLKGNTLRLLLDIYAPPSTDTVSLRPLIIFIHGGGFVSNNKVGAMSTSWLSKFACSGYVCASINYRLGVAPSKSDTAYFEALVRAVQDGKAAVRFFRAHASVYRIDTSQIFVMGTSAGSKTAIHMAYLTDEGIPSYIKSKLGSIEGTSGNPGYSSKVHGVINCWGAIGNLSWIKSGGVPIYNVHGTEDKTVPYDSSYSYHGLNYGSFCIYERARQVGIPTGWRPFYGAGHTLDNNRQKLDSAFSDFSGWLYTILNKK
jgi:predicted esterase